MPVLLATLPTVASGLRAQGKDAASVGSVVPDFEFPEFLVNGDGRQRLSEFHGRPVLIVNWTDTDFGRGAADKVRKLGQEFVPEGLVLILRETHNRSADEIRASALRLYPGSLARFTRHRKEPIAYADNGPPPTIALIDAEGKLLLAAKRLAELGTPEILHELELEKTLTKALEPLEKREPTAKDVAKLERLAKDAGDTRVGRRAQELARIAALTLR